MLFYRSVLFKGQIERRSSVTSPVSSVLGYSDRPVVVAINTEAIHIITNDLPAVSGNMGSTPFCGVLDYLVKQTYTPTY